MTRLAAPLPVPPDATPWIVRWARVLQGEHATRTITADDRVTALDFTVRVDASAGPVTVTLFSAHSLPGKKVVIKKIDDSANAVTVQTLGSDVIDGAATGSLPTPFDSMTLQSYGSGFDLL